MVNRMLFATIALVLLYAPVASAFLTGADPLPKCTFAAGVDQLSIAGSITRTCGAQVHGETASVVDAAGGSDCSNIPGAVSDPAGVALFLQWDDSLGAAGEWKCQTTAPGGFTPNPDPSVDHSSFNTQVDARITAAATDVHHTPTANTNAQTICTGATEVLLGDGSCTVPGGGFTPDADPGVDHSGFAGGRGITETAGSIALSYDDTLGGSPPFAAKECVFTTEGSSGGGFLCEGTVGGGGNGNEQIHLFPAQDGADTTDFIAQADSAGLITDFTNATDLDADGLVNTAHAGDAGHHAATVPGGSPTEFQYNNAGAFGGVPQIMFDGTNVDVTPTVGDDLVANETVNEVRNETGATLFMCTPVYFTGTTHASGVPQVDVADADANMPSIGLVRADIATGATGFAIEAGELRAADTDTTQDGGWSSGDALYVDASPTKASADCGEALTNVRPTGATALIQSVAFVTRVDASNGTLEVVGAGRVNDVPNAIVIGTHDTINTDIVTLDNDWSDAQVSDTLTASLFVGPGSTTTAIDLATTEVAGILPAANIHTDIARVSELHAQSHALDSASDHSGTLPDADLEDMLANTIVLRNAGTTGVRADVKISGLTEEPTPLALDWILGEDAAGNLRKYDVGNLPTGGGGEANTHSSEAGGLSIAAVVPKVGIDLRLKTLAAADFNLTGDVIDIDDATWATDAQVTAAINASGGTDLTCSAGVCNVDNPVAAATIASGVSANAIDQTAMADNAIGLPELAHGTDGNLYTFDAAGVPAFVATGTAEHFLTSNGAGLPPDFRAIVDGDIPSPHAGSAHHARSHALDGVSDHTGTLPDLDLENMAANTLMLRETGAGVRTDQRISLLSDEIAPAAGDFGILERADGTLARFDFDDLPSGSETNTLTGAMGGVASGEIPIGTTAGGVAAYVTLQPCDSDAKLEYTDGAPDTMTCEQISGLVNADIENMAANTLMLRETGAGVRTAQRISILSDEPSPAALDFLILERADGTLARADIGDLPGGGGGLWADRIGALTPVSDTDDVIIGGSDATCDTDETCIDEAAVSITTNSLITRAVAVPMYEADDSIADDVGEESRFVFDAVSDDNGKIEAQIENGVDDTYYEGWELSSTAGTPLLKLMANNTADFIQIADNGVMTAEGAASIAATTVATNANLTGPITSSGNATSIASQTGTGTQFAMATGPTLSDPIFTGSARLPIDGTLDANGEITVDATADQLQYRSGAATHVLLGPRTKCFTLPDPATADDDIPLWIEHPAITVTSMRCQVEGATNAAGFLSDGTNALDTMTCTETPVDDDGSIANATFTAGERFEWDTSTVSGTPTWLNMCWTYTVDPL